MNYRRMKPEPGRRLDYGNPLTKGLILWCPFPMRAPFFLNYAKATASGTIAGTFSFPDTPLGPAADQDGGGGNFISFGNPADWQFTDGSSWTMHAVTSIDGGGGSDRCILRKDPGGTRALYLLRLTTGNFLEMQLGHTSNVLDSRIGATALTADADRLRWLTGVRDVGADTTKVYVDGAEDATGTDASTGTWTATNGNLQTRFEAGASEHWNGKILLLAIWNRALTAREVLTLYQFPFAPMQPERARIFPVDVAQLQAMRFRKTMSSLGTRTGSRQAIGA